MRGIMFLLDFCVFGFTGAPGFLVHFHPRKTVVNHLKNLNFPNRDDFMFASFALLKYFGIYVFPSWVN